MVKIEKRNRRSFKNSIKYLKKEEWDKLRGSIENYRDKLIVTRSEPQGAAGNAKTSRGVQIGKVSQNECILSLILILQA